MPRPIFIYGTKTMLCQVIIFLFLFLMNFITKPANQAAWNKFEYALKNKRNDCIKSWNDEKTWNLPHKLSTKHCEHVPIISSMKFS